MGHIFSSFRTLVFISELRGQWPLARRDRDEFTGSQQNSLEDRFDGLSCLGYPLRRKVPVDTSDLIFGLYASYRFYSRDRLAEIGYWYAWIKDLMSHLITFALVLIFPLCWLYSNWAEFGNPFHFTSLAAGYQASYAGHRSLVYRSAAPFLTAWENAPGLIVSGIFSVPLFLHRKGWYWGVYLLPAMFNFLVLAASNALALSAPNQGPRSMVMYIWVLLPFVASIIIQLLSNETVAS